MEKLGRILDKACVFLFFFMMLKSSPERGGFVLLLSHPIFYFFFTCISFLFCLFGYVTALQLRIIRLCKTHKVTMMPTEEKHKSEG